MPYRKFSCESDNDVDLSDNDVDLSDNDVSLSDLYVHLSDLYVKLSVNFVVICMALTGKEHVLRIYQQMNK